MATDKPAADKTRSTAAPAEAEAPQPGDTATAPPQGTGSVVDQPRTAEDAPRAADPGDTVTVTLAHPLSNIEHLRRLGLDTDKENGYEAGEDITVRREDARSLITAGYAQVDPEDTDAVNRALGLTR
jgi:hypothetical protein